MVDKKKFEDINLRISWFSYSLSCSKKGQMLFLGHGFIVTFALIKGAFYQNSIVIASIK